MKLDLLLVAELSASLTLSLCVLGVIAVPLRKVVLRICPAEEFANFWIRYTALMLVAAPLALVLLVDLFVTDLRSGKEFQIAVLAAIGGLVIGMQTIASRLTSYERKLEKGEETS